MINLKSPEIRQTLRFAGGTCTYLWIAVVAANLPARLALAGHQADFGREPIAFAITGLAVDSIDFILIFLVINLAVAGIARGLGHRRLQRFDEAIRLTLVPTTSLLFALIMLGTIWASEHRIERGLYPTMYEFSSSVDKEFALAATKVFALNRFRYTPWVSLAIMVISSVGVVLGLKRITPRTGQALIASALGCSIIFGLCFA